MKLDGATDGLTCQSRTDMAPLAHGQHAAALAPKLKRRVISVLAFATIAATMLCGTATSHTRAADDRGSASPTSPQNGSRGLCTVLDSSPLERMKVENLLRWIAQLPEWPADRQLTDEEWEKYEEVAKLVQQEDPALVAFALDIATVAADTGLTTDGVGPLNRLRGRIAILLRVAFEVPAGKRIEHNGVVVHAKDGCAAIPVSWNGDVAGLDQAIMDMNAIGANVPVQWENGTPSLMGYQPRYGSSSGGMPNLGKVFRTLNATCQPRAL